MLVVVSSSGAQNLHNSMFRGILYSSMRFFESQPVGRILNRFSKDQSTVDELLPLTSFDFFQSACMVIGGIVVVAMTSPWILLCIPPLIPFFAYVRSKYLKSSREVKRLDATSRSPVYALFSSSLSGLMTLRAFQVTDNFRQQFLTAIDTNTRAFMSFLVITRWFGLRLDAIVAPVLFVSALVYVGQKETINASAAGFSLAYCLLLTNAFQWCVRQSAETENQMTSAERIVAYSELPPEGALIVPNNRPPEYWPAEGRVQFNNFQLRYRPELDLVLKGITVNIQSGEKIGVCGRTGAGK